MSLLSYTIKIERLLPYPTKQVWSAITDAELLGKWFMPTQNFEPKLGHAFTFQMKPQRGWDGITYCSVIGLEAPKQISFSYQGKATFEKTLTCANVDSDVAKTAVKGIFTELDTVLTFTLTPVTAPDGSEHTRFVLEHRGYDGLKLGIVGRVMGYGWRKSVLPRLSALLESQSPQAVKQTAEARSA